MNYTYIVKCSDGSLYTGWTNNLEKRIQAHNEGKVPNIQTRLPVELVYFEEFETKEEAMSRGGILEIIACAKRKINKGIILRKRKTNTKSKGANNDKL